MLKRRHFLLAGILAVSAAAVPAILARDGQVVIDDKNWTLASVQAMDGTMEVLTDGDTHPPIYQVNVLRPGRGVEDIHLQKPVPAEVLSPSASLHLCFRARAASPRKIRAALQDPQSEPWSHDISLTPDWQEFRLPVKPSAPVQGQAILAFQLGGTSGDLAISEIKLERS